MTLAGNISRYIERRLSEWPTLAGLAVHYSGGTEKLDPPCIVVRQTSESVYTQADLTMDGVHNFEFTVTMQTVAADGTEGGTSQAVAEQMASDLYDMLRQMENDDINQERDWQTVDIVAGYPLPDFEDGMRADIITIMTVSNRI